MGVDKNGMVLGVHTTPANEQDSKGLVPLLGKIKKEYKKSVSTDKAQVKRIKSQTKIADNNYPIQRFFFFV